MPTAPKTGTGKNVHEIMRSMRADPRIRISPSTGMAPADEDSLLDKVGAIKQKMQEQKLADMMVGQTERAMRIEERKSESDELELEVKTLENKGKLQMLKEALGESNGGNSQTALMIAMMEMMERMSVRQQAPDGPLDGPLKVIAEALGEMRAELRDRKDQHTEVDPMETLQKNVSMMVAMKDLFAALTPEERSSPVAINASNDLEVTIRQHEIEMSHQIRLSELNMQQERWRMEMQIKEREIQAEENRSKALGSSLGQLAETFKPVVAELSQQLMVNRNQPPPQPYAVQQMPIQYAPSEPETPQVQIEPTEPESVMLRCETCQNDVSVIVGTETVTCPHCGAVSAVDWNA